MRLTRGRGWIAVLGAMLVGIVAVNVISLSLTAGSGRLSLQIDELKTEISGLHAQIDERLSAGRVEGEAARLGLAVPDPKAITYLNAGDADAARLAHLLGTDSFLLAPSQPSSYPAPGTSYAPVSTTAPPPAPTTTVTPTTTPAATAPTTDTGSSSGTSSGTSSGSGRSIRRLRDLDPEALALSGQPAMRMIDRRLGLPLLRLLPAALPGVRPLVLVAGRAGRHPPRRGSKPAGHDRDHPG